MLVSELLLLASDNDAPVVPGTDIVIYFPLPLDYSENIVYIVNSL